MSTLLSMIKLLNLPQSHSSDFQEKSSSPNRQWRKVLYERQPYPDNFVDPIRFLDQLETSTDPSPFQGYIGMVLSTSVLVQQLTVVVIFLTIYKCIVTSSVTLFWVGLFDAILIVMGVSFRRWLSFAQNEEKKKNRESILQSLHYFFLFGAFLRISAPVLQTLTSSFSKDTIHALAITFSVLHLTFHDYAFINFESVHKLGTLSLNAAMFTAVLLASQLDNIEMVVAFVLLAVICFSFFPEIARLIKSRSLTLHLVITGSQWALASSLLFFVDKTHFIVYEFIVLFVWLVCPMWLLKMQRYKKGLRGPWDIPAI